MSELTKKQLEDHFGKKAVKYNKMSVAQIAEAEKECKCDNCEMEKHWTPLDKNMLNNLEEKDITPAPKLTEDLGKQINEKGEFEPRMVDLIKGWNLSSKRNNPLDPFEIPRSGFINVSDVKEFIRQLRADIKLNISTSPLVDRIIDKLAGEELI